MIKLIYKKIYHGISEKQIYSTCLFKISNPKQSKKHMFERNISVNILCIILQFKTGQIKMIKK